MSYDKLRKSYEMSKKCSELESEESELENENDVFKISNEDKDLRIEHLTELVLKFNKCRLGRKMKKANIVKAENQTLLSVIEKGLPDPSLVADISTINQNSRAKLCVFILNL